SNRVCIYSPRFAVVRQVTDLQEYARYDNPMGFGQLTSLAKIDENEKASTSLAKTEASLNRNADSSSLLAERQQAGELEHNTHLAADIGTLSPYANLQIVQTGAITGEERIELARAGLAAVTWTADQAPRITIDSR